MLGGRPARRRGVIGQGSCRRGVMPGCMLCQEKGHDEEGLLLLRENGVVTVPSPSARAPQKHPAPHSRTRPDHSLRPRKHSGGSAPGMVSAPGTSAPPCACAVSNAESPCQEMESSYAPEGPFAFFPVS